MQRCHNNNSISLEITSQDHPLLSEKTLVLIPYPLTIWRDKTNRISSLLEEEWMLIFTTCNFKMKELLKIPKWSILGSKHLWNNLDSRHLHLSNLDSSNLHNSQTKGADQPTQPQTSADTHRLPWTTDKTWIISNQALLLSTQLIDHHSLIWHQNQRLDTKKWKKVEIRETTTILNLELLTNRNHKWILELIPGTIEAHTIQLQTIQDVSSMLEALQTCIHHRTQSTIQPPPTQSKNQRKSSQKTSMSYEPKWNKNLKFLNLKLILKINTPVTTTKRDQQHPTTPST